MKKIAIMQPYFFPYIGYWQLINAVDEFLVYDDVNYIKGGWINRNNILLNSQKHLLTLPLSGASSYLPINQIGIIEDEKQKEKLIKTIEQAYKKAPYYDDVFPIIYETIFHPSQNVAKAIYHSIQLITKYLNINTKITLSSSLEKNNNLKGQDKVIHVCKLLNTTTYVNAIGGLELYDKPSFAKEGMELLFLKTKEIKYNQLGGEGFIPMLSMVDVLMFNDVKTVQNFLDEYTLI